MKTKLSLAAAAIAFTTMLPVVQAVVPFAGSSAAFAKHGADDKPGHDANDDKGGRRGGHGADDKAGHHANDDKGGKRGGHGADDKGRHHLNDDKAGTRNARR